MFLALALALGGGGSPSPLPEMLLEWIALATLVGVVWLKPNAKPWPRLALGLAGALFVLPALHLVPLPPDVWRGLPGREVEAAALDLVGAGERWMPLSVSPPRTLAALLAMLVPAIAVVVAALASPRSRMLGLAALAAMALLSVGVGFVQLADGPGSALRFYAQNHIEDLTGFQANRNAQADVLLIGLLAVGALIASLPSHWRARGLIVAGPVAVLLASGVILTASRMGTLLLAAAALAALAVLAVRYRTHLTGLQKLVLGGTVLAIAAAFAWAVGGAPSRIAVRLAQGGAETRPEIWRDTLFAIDQVWPWGGGVGTFVPVFIAAERLEAVDPSYPNRAHNDFLELALEAGLPGVLVLIALGGLLVWRLRARLCERCPSDDQAQLWFAGSALTVVALHSIVDYPLRSMALAAAVGAAAGFILTGARQSGGVAPPGRAETRLA